METKQINERIMECPRCKRLIPESSLFEVTIGINTMLKMFGAPTTIKRKMCAECINLHNKENASICTIRKSVINMDNEQQDDQEVELWDKVFSKNNIITALLILCIFVLVLYYILTLRYNQLVDQYVSCATRVMGWT